MNRETGPDDAADHRAFEHRITDLLERLAADGPEPISRLESVMAATTPFQPSPESPARSSRLLAAVAVAAVALTVLALQWPQQHRSVDASLVPADAPVDGLTADSEVVLHRLVSDTTIPGLVTKATVTLDDWVRPLSLGHPTDDWLHAENARRAATFADRPDLTPVTVTDPKLIWCVGTETSAHLECLRPEGQPALARHSLATVWLDVPSSAVIVVHRDGDGRTWQRPVSDVAAFPSSGVHTCSDEPEHLDAYAADGTLLASVDLCQGTYLVAPPALGA